MSLSPDALALMREIKKYSSAGRMVLTGTPLHVRVLSPLLLCFPSRRCFGPSPRGGSAFVSTVVRRCAALHRGLWEG